MDNPTNDVTDEFLLKELKGERLLNMVLADERICNAVIAKYLDDISGAHSVPVIKGYSALSVLPKPKTLEDAKKIVDGA